jgi:isoleucyl-tRNA synthetase
MMHCRSAPYPFHQILDPKSPLGIDRSQYVDIQEDIPWLLNANMAIKRAQEDARTQKLIKSSLQSSVVLILPEQSKDMFEKYIDDLEAIFVVSSVALENAAGSDLLETKLSDWLEGARSFSAEFDVPGGKGTAWVLPPKDAKCPRCWRYVAPVEDELCARCDDLVGEKKSPLPKNPLSRNPLSQFWK